MDYQLVHSNRRTIALVIDRRGNLIVRAPRRAAISDVEDFIRQKQNWIAKHQQRQKALVRPKQYATGEKFWFLGREHPLEITDDYRSRLNYGDGKFTLSRFQTHKAKKLFEDWYKSQAKSLLPQRAKYWADKMKTEYKGIRVTSAISRWGSCSSLGTINFSWRLLIAPLDVIDYVVIHELAHTVHHNHSQKFWQLVSVFCPAYQVMRQWLRRQGKSQGL